MCSDIPATDGDVVVVELATIKSLGEVFNGIIPVNQMESGLTVVRSFLTEAFVEQCFQLYHKYEDLESRQAITFIFRRISFYGKRPELKYIAKRDRLFMILEACRSSYDIQIVDNLVPVLQNISYNRNKPVYVDMMVECGILDFIKEMLQKWGGNDKIIIAILGVFAGVIDRRIDIKHSKSTVLQKLSQILQSFFQTSNNTTVVHRTITVIGNLLLGTNAQHEFYMNQDFIDSTFFHLQNGVVDDSHRDKIIWKIITNMLVNDPLRMKPLLVPYIQPIQKLAAFDSDGTIAKRCAKIVNTFLSCKEDKHKCRIIGSFGKLMIAKFTIAYIIDFIGDIIVGFKTINDTEINSHWEGSLLLFFSLAPLIYINILSIRHFKWSNHRTISTDPVVSLNGNSAGPMLQYFIPWRFDTVKNSLFNILTLFQMHPIISAAEIVWHRPQLMNSLYIKIFNFRRLAIQEKMLENVPCILIKVILMYKIYRFSDVRDADYITFVTTAISIMTLITSIISFEKLCRLAELSDNCYAFTGKPAFILCYIGFLGMILSKVIMCLLLYHVSNRNLWIFGLAMGAHVLLTFLVHLFSRHHRYDPFTSSTDKKFAVLDFLFSKEYDRIIYIKSIIMRVFMTLFLSWSEFFVVMLRHPIEFLKGHPHTVHLRSSMCFLALYTLNVVEVGAVGVVVITIFPENSWAFHLGYISISLYVLSGIMFFMFFVFFHPEKMRKFPSMRYNQRYRLLLTDTGEKGVIPFGGQFCQLMPSNKANTLQFHGKKVHKAANYNFRLQLLEPCQTCIGGKQHGEVNLDNNVVESSLNKISWMMQKVENWDKMYREELLRLTQEYQCINQDEGHLNQEDGLKFNEDMYSGHIIMVNQITNQYNGLLEQYSNGTEDIPQEVLVRFTSDCQNSLVWSALMIEDLCHNISLYRAKFTSTRKCRTKSKFNIDGVSF